MVISISKKVFLLKEVILKSRQLFFTSKQIQRESVLWLRRLLLFVRLNEVFQSSCDLLNNH